MQLSFPSVPQVRFITNLFLIIINILSSLCLKWIKTNLKYFSDNINCSVAISACPTTTPQSAGGIHGKELASASKLFDCAETHTVVLILTRIYCVEMPHLWLASFQDEQTGGGHEPVVYCSGLTGSNSRCNRSSNSPWHQSDSAKLWLNTLLQFQSSCATILWVNTFLIIKSIWNPTERPNLGFYSNLIWILVEGTFKKEIPLQLANLKINLDLGLIIVSLCPMMLISVHLNLFHGSV